MKSWTINVASRVKHAPQPCFSSKDIIGKNLLSKVTFNLTRFYYSHITKNAPPPGSHDFHPTGIIFELVQDIIGIYLLTKFHEDQTINVASRVKNAPPLGVTIFEFNRHIQKTHVLTKFHEDWTKNVTSRRHCFSPIWTIFKLIQDINETNVSTKFHDDWAKIVTSRMFTRNNAF
ncbi:hypothetical protein DPMN_165068 [Dreissena polymorpha]|uniref:Uncharacterized protein n=1 Tax=Dreissena polymorpha TaxID=45954 RepID=A0A9D4IU98_DREPO|nr:hypothetical protein DPMN_165068 [Dreissena polymorpha]